MSALRTILAVFLVIVLAFATITVFQNLGRNLRVDCTGRKLYTLSDGTKAILGKLNQPIRVKLYYARTAVLKSRDWIERWHNYFLHVEDMLREYAAAAGGKIRLEVVDPRPFSQEEEDARQNGLRLFSMPGEKNEFFVFGLTVQSEFGQVKSIEYLDPDRERFVEYDITSLIDAIVTRQKKKIGILSSLPMFGEYAGPMMGMSPQPRPPWIIVNHLRDKFEVDEIQLDADKIEDVDILLVVHPKNLAKKTLFAIDQFVLKGGRAIIFVDPFCYADPPPQRQPYMQPPLEHAPASNLQPLLAGWGLEMPDDLVAGDYDLAEDVTLRYGERPRKLITLLKLDDKCMNADSAISAELGEVTVLAAGALRETGRAEALKLVPLIRTTSGGNAMSPLSRPDMMMPNPENLMNSFTKGSKPVVMGYLVTGKPKSAFPQGIEADRQDEQDKTDLPAATPTTEPAGKPATKPATMPAPKRKTGIAEAKVPCAVVVFSDVDFISDRWAYRDLYGMGITTVSGDNASLVFNAIDVLSGSDELISIRSRGSFKRPFDVVDEIEKQAEKETEQEAREITGDIEKFRNELKLIGESSEGKDEKLIQASVLQKKKELESKLRKRERDLRNVQMKRRERIEQLGSRLQNLNMLAAPMVILAVAVALAAYRTARRWRFTRRANR